MMGHVPALLFIATLITLRMMTVRMITRSPKPCSFTRWGGYAIISLIGLSLSTPIAFGHEYDKPGSDGIKIVTCNLNDRNSAFVAQAIAKHDPQLFNDLGEKCHLPADGVLAPKDCDLFTNSSNIAIPLEIQHYLPTIAPCFNDTPAVRFAIFDPLGPEQVSELADISLNSERAESIFINQAMPGELLIISVPKADVYAYTMELNSYYDKGACPTFQHRTKLGTLNIRNGSFFVATEEDCNSEEIWLADRTPLSN